MSEEPLFDRRFDGVTDRPVEVAPGVRRVTAGNAGPFTFTGTNSYIVGGHSVAVIDPGPPDPAHRAALDAALEGRSVAAVIVTHTHRDHSPLARPLAEAHGAPVYGFGPHVPARPPRLGEETPMDAANDMEFTPDHLLRDGAVLEGPEWRFEAIHTPGHTANHICLALEGSGTLFSGDHVMAWSTTVIAPPDGSMADYMASLERLGERKETLFLPGHGAPVENPRRFVRGLLVHRRQRETAILERLSAGERTIPELVGDIYAGLDPRLKPAAGLSVLAHLEDLVARGLAGSDGPPSIGSTFRRA